MSPPDVIFGAGSLFFAASLIPSVRGEQKPNILTSAVTALWLWIFVSMYIYMHFIFSALSTGASAVLWSVLFAQEAQRCSD
jgi:hypothetical protein